MDGLFNPRGARTSPRPANWGLAPQPRLLAPKSPPPPPPDSSANLGGPPALPFNQRTSLTTQRRPPAFLAVSHGPRCSAEIRVPRGANIPA
ncbi:hypothetical protein EYF80_012764 [Liparis tanakae]|uniref:Uncharacterized protein n=1 Tax=Liparis tanakae TaxID=230148 RepID=A0A4Z2IG82_9TELE|nr:hypothetical protein EYF80_012764 [Liparis tanakae]